MTISPEWITAIASLAGVAGVAFAFWQLRSTRSIAQDQFANSLAKEYRDLVAQIPTKALLGEALAEDEYIDAFDELYRYIDLSNEEVFLMCGFVDPTNAQPVSIRTSDRQRVSIGIQR